MNLRTANNRRKKALFCDQAVARFVWLNYGFYRKGRASGKKFYQVNEYGVPISSFRWTR